MIQYNAEELAEKLRLHEKWLNDTSGGKRLVLRDATLSYANLRWANLRWANLSYADLSNSDLSNSDLRGANLRGANLRGAYLRHADLRYSDLRGAYLRYSDLRWANLRWANLSYADLSNSDLRYSDLRGAYLSDAKNIAPIVMSELSLLPSDGAFVGWKRVNSYDGAKAIAKLQVTETALRSNATGRKCRCSEALVLAIETADGKPLLAANSTYDSTFIYRVGETVSVSNFELNRWEECAPGIHFFITKEEAMAY